MVGFMEMNLTQEDKNLVAAVVRAEAEGEGELGQIAVLSVIWTRAMRSPFYGWPGSMAGVVKQPHQFSCLNPSDPTYTKIQSWLKSPGSSLRVYLNMIEKFLAGELSNPVPGADHYLNPATANKSVVENFDKSFRLVRNINRHRFYEAASPRGVGEIAPLYLNPVRIQELSNRRHVELIQRQLNLAYGNNLAVDGVVDDKTVAAWRKFKNATYQIAPDLVGRGSLSVLERGRAVTVKEISTKAPETFAEKIVTVCDRRSFPLLRNGNYNIIGVEGVNPDGTPNNDAPDQWNDVMMLLRFVGGQPVISWIAQSTTEPGRYYTDRPMVPAGVARLDTGYHPDIWSRGLHKGHSAMVQAGKARLVRDLNRNHMRDDRVTVEQWRGINWHAVYGGVSASSIGMWSAGCCVTLSRSKFDQAMKMLDDQGHRASYDFILIWRDWLKQI